MAAARPDPSTRGAWLAASGCAACLLLTGGAAALITQAGLGPRASATWMSALTLATMIGVPAMMVRSSGRQSVLPTAAALILAMSAMSIVPSIMNTFVHGGASASLCVMAGGVLLIYWLRFASGVQNRVDQSRHSAHVSEGTFRAGATTVSFALLAGLSSGALARFQFFSVCGVNGAHPLWQSAVSLLAVCVLATVFDKRERNMLLSASYAARAMLIALLPVVDTPAAAPLVANMFLILDCLTIPALMRVHGKYGSTLSASCPGGAHHIGVVLGAALSTTPYFFGSGFVALFLMSALANLLCAVVLLQKPQNKNSERPATQRTPPVVEAPFGARSAAGRMTALSLRWTGARVQSLRGHETLQARGPT
jgi:hypothetical protein